MAEEKHRTPDPGAGGAVAQKGLPHGDAQRFHARKRASERFGLDLTWAEYNGLCLKLGKQYQQPTDDCVLLNQQSHRLWRWAIWFKGEWMPVVFDNELRNIVTFLPASYLRQHRNKLPW